MNFGKPSVRFRLAWISKQHVKLNHINRTTFQLIHKKLYSRWMVYMICLNFGWYLTSKCITNEMNSVSNQIRPHNGSSSFPRFIKYHNGIRWHCKKRWKKWGYETDAHCTIKRHFIYSKTNIFLTACVRHALVILFCFQL